MPTLNPRGRAKTQLGRRVRVRLGSKAAVLGPCTTVSADMVCGVDLCGVIRPPALIEADRQRSRVLEDIRTP